MKLVWTKINLIVELHVQCSLFPFSNYQWNLYHVQQLI